MTYITTFQVTGNLTFPLDMLRYDQCFPADSESALRIQESVESHGTVVVGPVALRTFHSAKTPSLTDERWRSFGWHVAEISETRRVSR